MQLDIREDLSFKSKIYEFSEKSVKSTSTYFLVILL